MAVFLAVTQVSPDSHISSYIALMPDFAAIKLSYIMSEYYEANNRDPQACSFAGNGTVNPLAPSSVSAANSAATSCVSNPAATFTPTAPAAGSGGSSTGTTSTSAKHNSAISLFVDGGALVGMGVMAAIGFASAVWTLA
jgi:hypothetical protein